MDSDEGKLFVGGLAWDTKEETLKDHFSLYGVVSQAVIMRDKTTGRPRGFGFVVFSDPSLLDRVLQDKHTIDGRTVEAKRALSREEQHTNSRSDNFNSVRGSSGGNFKTRKIFVGGLPATLTEDGFREYFENYGHVTDVVVMYDQHTQRPRGFGFITFDTEDSVDRVLHKTFHELNGKNVEVKRALPKDAISGGGGRGGGHQGYGTSSGNTNTTDVQMDGNRYMQPQSSAGGYGPYSGYNTHNYGYGAVNSGVGYSGYGSYGVGGYGSGGSGFGGPTGAYGMPGTLKSSWGSQGPSSYGASGYVANSGYGTTAPWNASASGGSAAVGQSPGGTPMYGNQVYGYGSYGGSEGSFTGGYGAAGGRAGNAPHSSGGGAGGIEQQGRGSGYSEVNSNSGYANEGWRSEPSQVSGSYGGGYGGSLSGQPPFQ